MSQKLYVAVWPYSVTDGQLEELFAEHGTVESARVIADKFYRPVARLRFRGDGLG